MDFKGLASREKPFSERTFSECDGSQLFGGIQMQSLKIILAILVLGTAAYAAPVKGKLVDVADVRIDLETGCGVPDPVTGGCNIPDQTTVSFTVPTGGLCHTYTAKTKMVGRNNMLSIIDVVQPNCTRPEQMEISTSVPLEGRFRKGAIKLENALFVRTHFRP
jgi:hypothetical protein